ncbi:sulfurtransferase [Sinosporangium siamense]|uniref:Sulfurtransferase n=1 Tax=Sinosporangium siamense TaxID=1367973 RepID=A0A919REV9_9ACTN|nr:sulfurtransferase [Sinosporangium siamense]GII90504.1 sulfurtransferase [Sinosporangium siamense]
MAPPGNPLVTADWLAERIGDPGVVVVEVQYEPDVDEYSAGHIPGARHVFWKDLFWADDVREFRNPAEAAEMLGSLGVGPDTTLVFYSGRGQFAAYGYWVFHEMNGHPDVRVLSGGRAAWRAAGHPLVTEAPGVTAVAYKPLRAGRDDSTRIGKDEVLGLLGKPGVVLLDGRYAEEYHGERVKPGDGFDHGAERHGHIPGAVNLCFKDLIDPATFKLLPPDQLEAAFRAHGAGPDQADQVIAYCRLGHRGSLLWFAASALLGWDHVRVYDGSWTEWGSSVGTPITGPTAERKTK